MIDEFGLFDDDLDLQQRPEHSADISQGREEHGSQESLPVEKRDAPGFDASDGNRSETDMVILVARLDRSGDALRHLGWSGRTAVLR